MIFKLSTVFVMAKAILLAVAMPSSSTDSANSTEMATNVYGCFRQGELWKDLGTKESIIAAYDQQWCKLAVGMHPRGGKSNRCIRGDQIKHAFRWEWEVTKVANDGDEGYISHDVCICFIAQAVDLCEKGGILNLVCGPGDDGGEIIGIHVTADPQGSFSCHG